MNNEYVVLNHESELQLSRRKFCRVEGQKPGTLIQCKKGTLWVTQSGDIKDYILFPGDQFSSRKRGRILIEALREADVQIVTKN